MDGRSSLRGVAGSGDQERKRARAQEDDSMGKGTAVVGSLGRYQVHNDILATAEGGCSR